MLQTIFLAFERCTSVYIRVEGNIVTPSCMSISSWIISLDVNAEESRLFCIVLQA